MANAYEVFEALAKGYVRFSDILSQSKVTSSPTLAYVLEKLIKMDVVVKESPINAMMKATRKRQDIMYQTN